MRVTRYLERARDCANIAERVEGEDKRKLLAMANAWMGTGRGSSQGGE
jgi:hypothetical protein